MVDRRVGDRRGGRDPACQGFDEARAGAGVTDDTAAAIAPAVLRRRGNPLQQLGAGANESLGGSQGGSQGSGDHVDAEIVDR